MTYELPAIGGPPDGPTLEKIAVEEHFDVLSARDTATAGDDLQSLVRAMDYDSGWMGRVAHRLRDFGADRLAGMDAAGISVAIFSHTVPGVQGIVDPATAVPRRGDQRSSGQRNSPAPGATPGLPASRFRTRDAAASNSNARSLGSGSRAR